MTLVDNLNIIKKQIPSDVKLVAVSKYHSINKIKEIYNAGHKIFGENKVQELDEKQKSLPNDIVWHFIGHLQTNKVKYIVPYIDTIQSVDSWKLLTEIEKQAAKVKRQIKCLLEIHIAQEDSKYGFTYEKCIEFLSEKKWETLNYAHICGIMGMASNTNDEEQVKAEFKRLKLFFNKLKKNYFENDNLFSEISMGMSNDYTYAIKEGATIVRVGSAIFGNREYH